MNILVTGGTGFIGSRLAEKLVEKGYHIKCLVRETSNQRRLKDLGIEIIRGDITDKNSLNTIIDGVDVVYHIAGVLGQWGTPDRIYWEINVQGTKNLLEACKGKPIKRFIYCSSAVVSSSLDKPKIDGITPMDPSNVYDLTKAEAEKLVLDSYIKNNLPVTIIRPEFVYGPGDIHLLGFFTAIKNRKFLLIGDGKSTLHPTYIDDVIQSFLLCLENEKSIGKIYYIAGRETISVKEFSQIISENLQVPLSKLSIPVWLAHIVPSCTEPLSKLFGINPILTHSRVKLLSEDRRFDISKAKRELNYEPTMEIDIGIRRTIDWYRENKYI